MTDSGKIPASGIVVYAFQIRPAGAAAGASRVTGSRSTVTDGEGRYLFDDLDPGDYRLEPSMNTFTFQPATVTLGEGTEAPTIEAMPVNLNDTGCEVTDFVQAIVAADAKSRQLFQFGIDQIEAKLKDSVLSRESSRSLRRTLSGARTSLQSSYTAILKRSKQLPKITIECGKRANCSMRTTRRTLIAYRAHIDNLRRLRLLVLRIGRGKNAESGMRDATLGSSVCRLHQAATRATKQLPRGTDVCSN